MSPLAGRIKALLSKQESRPVSETELAALLSAKPREIKRALLELKAGAVNLLENSGGLYVAPEIPKAPPTRIPITSLRGREFLFGVTADNHLCSRYARMDVLNTLFDIWADQGVETVLVCGNMIDGEAPFNRGDLVAFGVDGQVDYFIQNWPARKGIQTMLLTGDDHEGWYVRREGLNIGRYIESSAKRAGREDIVFLGHMEHDMVFRVKGGQDIVMRLIHGGGGSAYAMSYRPQKIVESYTGGQKPQILLIGHYHKLEYCYPRGVHAIQVGATQDQTPFLRKKSIESHLGGVTLRFTQSRDGLVHGVTPQFHTFYDRDFYESRQWRYFWNSK